MRVQDSLLIFADCAIPAALIAHVERDGEEAVGGTIIFLTTGREISVEESMDTVVDGWAEALEDIDARKFELAEATRPVWPKSLKVRFLRGGDTSFDAEIIS